ncbi:MAG: ATP-binding protein [Clostridium sp.]|nr:ATP-binding protein [Clostridium sp.]
MIPNEQELMDNLGKIAYTLDKAYISKLSSDYGVWYFNEKYNKDEAICYINNIRALKVDRWIFDKDEKSGECFKNVLSLFADGDHSIALVVKRTVSSTEMYFVVKNEGQARNEDSKSNIGLLNSSLQGNFPGTHTTTIDDVEEIEELFKFEDADSIAVLSNSPSEYSDDYITQGLDKLLNGIVPCDDSENYSVVFLAESLTQENIREVLSGFEDIATAIVPFLEYQFQIGTSETNTQGEMKSITNTESISESIFKTHSINIGVNGSINSSRSISDTVSEAESKTKSTNIGINASKTKALFKLLRLGVNVGASVAKTVAKTTATTVSNTLGKSLGLSTGYGYSWGTSKTVSNGSTETTGTSSSISLGKSENTNYTYKSYMVNNMLEKLEKTMKRMNESQATGLWKFSTYVLAKDAKISKNVANYLRAITQGKESFIEPSVIQEWSKVEGNEATAFDEIKKYITHFTHPIFVTLANDDKDIMMVTATSYVATDELSHVIAFPRKSLQGLPVLECVQFGREPHSLLETENDLEIGSGYHMHQKVETQRIKISKEELTKHTFITGSTGSGKSNTTYKLLECLEEENVKFLVIEPAKGEYKTVLGKKNNVTVYGTNPKLKDSKLLQINPFRFPKKTHILEHMDRLVEIFNVCWPMYAAMPAILKDSIERAYVAAGWDLINSENKYDENLFPNFSDVLIQIKVVLEESDYSDDNKGDYTGSLVTRLKSLTNGINGLIFTAEDIQDSQLFDENVIVDLSRVGSSETKALIMGLLVLKLQEYRMQSPEPNTKIHHVTVLEEAHNLLRRASSQGSNLLEKSVEMLANSIAEMRTYGEGFIIVDQSPGLLDMSVIRNTNTKIILRLLDFSDRELVGKAAGLNDSQIIELGRLEKGVASITQSNWLEPVLCKIDKYEGRNDNFHYQGTEKKSENKISVTENDAKKLLLESIMNKELYRKGDRIDIQKLRALVIRSNLNTTVKCEFIEYIQSDKDTAVDSLRRLIYDFFEASNAIKESRSCTNIVEWSNNVLELLKPSIEGYSKKQINLVIALIIYEQARRDCSYNNLFCRFTELYKEKGSVI